MPVYHSINQENAIYHCEIGRHTTLQECWRKEIGLKMLIICDEPRKLELKAKLMGGSTGQVLRNTLHTDIGIDL